MLAVYVAWGGVLGGLALTTRAQNPVNVTATTQRTPEQAAQKIAALEKQVADLQAEVARLKAQPAAPSFFSNRRLPQIKNCFSTEKPTGSNF